VELRDMKEKQSQEIKKSRASGAPKAQKKSPIFLARLYTLDFLIIA